MSYSGPTFAQQAFLNPGPAPPPPGGEEIQPSYAFPYSRSSSSVSSSSGATITALVPSNTSPVSTPSGHTSTYSRDDFKSGQALKQGWASVKEDGSIRFMWSKKFLVLRDNSLDLLKNEVGFSRFLRIIILHFGLSN
jgi:hypothetical protein